MQIAFIQSNSEYLKIFFLETEPMKLHYAVTEWHITIKDYYS